MEKPLVSFIIAYYDLPVRMLCECIDSIRSLSLHPAEREIIVVDDGSKDSPVNQLMHYGDDIIYVRQQNKGLSGARNTGIQMATGQYLQFIDADDLLLQTPYNYCLQQLRATHPDMLVFDFSRTGKNPCNPCNPLFKKHSGADYMRHYNIRGSACCYLFHRSILGDLRFTTGIFHEDEEFTPQLILRAETLIVTNAQAYLYRQREDSITTVTSKRHLVQRLEDTRGIILRLSTLADRLPSDDRAALQRRIAQLTMDYLYNIIRQTRSRHYLLRKISLLRRDGLYPLPNKCYTLKYTLFRLII